MPQKKTLKNYKKQKHFVKKLLTQLLILLSSVLDLILQQGSMFTAHFEEICFFFFFSLQFQLNLLFFWPNYSPKTRYEVQARFQSLCSQVHNRP